MSVFFKRAALTVMALMAASAAVAQAVKPLANPLPAPEAIVAANPALMRGATILGNAKGNVTIISFTDYACSYCKAVEPRVAQLLKSDKNVKLLIKELPILTPESLVAAKAALAAVKQGKYAPFHQALMSYDGLLDNRAIFDTAKAVGLNVAQLQKDMAAPAIADEIIANFNLARSLRVFQTPTFIIGNQIRMENSSDLNFPRLVAEARKK
jgi:protein-disulfide isomerase